MDIIDFEVIDWSKIAAEEHPGIAGMSWWRVRQFGGLRVRLVEYGPGYLADHWCRKGHIVHCLEGEFVSEMEDGTAAPMRQGMTYVVSDDRSSHRSRTEHGVKLLIIDGRFLANGPHV